MLAIGWEPEIRGALTVILAIVVLCGSVYLILATNVGARLGILIALAGLSGWIMLMGLIWMIYGIGLKGPEPSWVAVPGRTVLQDDGALFQASVLQTQVDVPAGSTPAESAQVVQDQFIAEGWERLPGGGSVVRAGGGVGRASSSRRAARSPPGSSRPSPCTTSAASGGR